MTESTTIVGDRELKSRHQAMWALGNYQNVATDLITSLGSALVRACKIGPGQRVLDVAAGTGNVAVPAAFTGAEVTASDLTPELLAAGERSAPTGLKLTWQQADVEQLPFADDTYDAVTSCVGVQFAPHHQQAADEIIRVAAPGGTIGLLSWTPAGFIGQMFAAMKPYAPPPPPGAQPPPLWGDEDHVRALFGDRVTDITAHRDRVRVDRFTTGEEFREYFKTNYGPTIAVYRSLADSPDRAAELDQALADVARRFTGTDGAMEWEYLLFTARKR